jgi:coproporphyrinogen III oxidase-like Fe-S oxidoreductase
MLTRLATPYLRRMHRAALSFASHPGASAMPAPDGDRRYLLYVHIPFCPALCPFCSFHRVTYNASLARRYFRALREEIARYAERGFQFADVYVGGGTPTVDLPELLETLALIRSRFSIERISVETNPDHLHPEILEALKDAGVNRLSVGVQSFDDALLKEMKRYDRYGSGDMIRRRLEAVMGCMDTLNVDMMFNYPHQTGARLERDLDILNECAVDQVSFYPLMAAESVARNMRRTMGSLSVSREREFYYRILDRMAATYETSSVWCFSRRAGLVDEYIIDHDQYVGVGSGAFSYLDGTLYATSFSILDYDRQIEQQGIGISRSRELSRREQLRFFLLTTLFSTRMNFDALERSLGVGAARELSFEINALRLVGTVRRDRDELALTRRGHYHWLVMMREFLNAINNLRDQMRSRLPTEYNASYPEEAVPVRVQ